MAMWSLLSLALFVWPGLMIWAILVFFIAGPCVSALSKVTKLPIGRRFVGDATLVVLGLIPIPLLTFAMAAIWDSLSHIA